MNIRKNNGIVGTDIVIAIIAAAIFSTLIISMIYNNVTQNVKLKKETLAMIYMTEFFENVGIANYDYINTTNVSNLIPEEAKNLFDIQVDVSDTFSGVPADQYIMKKIQAVFKYEVGGNIYTCSMERLKIKE